MFSPAAHSVRQKIFSHILEPTFGHNRPIELNETELLDPDTLSGADQVAFYDLKEHEDRYDVLMSTRFDFASLVFKQNLDLANEIAGVDPELVVRYLALNNHANQKFIYRVNALRTLLDFVQATQCAHSALLAQRQALITALNLELSTLVQSAVKQWSLQACGEIERHGLRIVQPEYHRAHVYTSPIALSIMVLTAIIHCIMGASRESGNFILSSLKAILSLASEMQGSRAQHFTHQHLRDAPDTLASTLHFLGLPPPLQRYVTCPRCSCLYRELDHVQVPQNCTSRNIDGAVCGEPMFSNSYRGGRSRRKPIRQYSHQMFESWLTEILLRPGVEDMLESAAPLSKDLMTDVWHGTYWKNFPRNGDEGFFDAPKNELRLCMLLYHDFFNPLRNKTAGKLKSIGCFYMICLNLPPDLCYDTSFAYLASIVPGPSEPSMEQIQSFIRPIADEMLELYNPGIWVNRTHKYPQGRRVRVAAPLNCMDGPAARAFGGFASHGHTCFCYLCSATLDRIGGNSLSEFVLRTVDTHRAQASQWENAQSLALRNRLFEAHGVRNCEWLRFGWWNTFSSTVIGPMHWIRNVLDKQLRRNMNWSWTLPTGIPQPPPLSRPISKLEYEWGQRALYELDGESFMQYKLPEPLVRHLCRERGIYEAGLSARCLMAELNQWRIACGIVTAEGNLTQGIFYANNSVPLSVAKAHYYLSKATRATMLQSHASLRDLQILCQLFGLSPSGLKLDVAERLISHYANVRIQDLPNTASYAKPKKEATAVLGIEVMTEVQNDMGRTTLPRWIKHPPKNFGTVTHGKLQSEEYKSLALVSFVLTLVRLWGVEPHGPFREHLDNFLHLMLAIRILSFQSIMESDIIAFEYHYGRYLKDLSRLYPYASRTPSQHMGLHIPSFLHSLGPSTRLSESTCEMYIGILQDISTNSKFGDLESTIHREFIMAARLKGLIEQKSFADGLGQFGELVRGYLGGKMPGRVGNGWIASHIASPTNLSPDQSILLNAWAKSHRTSLLPEIYTCSSIRQGNLLYAPFTHSAGDSCVLFCHPSTIGPHPGRIDIIIDDSGNGRFALLVRPFIPLSAEDAIFDPYWAHPLVGEKGAAIARLYYDDVSPMTILIEPHDIVSHVAICNFNDTRILKGCVAVLSLDLPIEGPYAQLGEPEIHARRQNIHDAEEESTSLRYWAPNHPLPLLGRFASRVLMNPNISQQSDGWYVQVDPNNTLGLDIGIDTVANRENPIDPQAVHAPHSASIAYYVAAPNTSQYAKALSDDMQLTGPENESTSIHNIYSSKSPSPTYPLRPLPPSHSAASLTRLFSSVSSPKNGRIAPPIFSAPPQLPLQLPPQFPRLTRGLDRQSGRPRKRKRARRDSPESSGNEGNVSASSQILHGRANLLSASSATQHLADPRPVNDDEGSNSDMEDGEEVINMGDKQVVESLYEEAQEGDIVDLRKLCDLVNQLLQNQAHLTRSIRQIDARTQEWVPGKAAGKAARPSSGGGTYVSPPTPPEVINWDQAILHDEPAGRRRRAKRRVLLMGLIRETIFKLLARHSVHEPLPPPPPPALRVPTLLNFAIRWEESSKSVFNKLATNIVAQKITHDQPHMLTPEEAEELPSMLYATRLQVLDKFPEHLGKHRHLIVHLGVDGTSSDEEDPRGSGIYKIRNKPQLSSKVTLLKRDLDHVYQLYFKGPGTKGSQVHQRVPSNINSTRPFLIQGLPISCISRSWYQELDSAEREFYEFVPHNYDFSFPASLLNVQASGWPAGERSRDVSP